MKRRIQWVVALLVAASTTAAMGYYSCSTTYVHPSSPDWGAPFRTIGHVVSAPFVALGNALSPSPRYVEPVGERFTTYPMVTYSSSRLMPVGERFTTVRVIHKPMLKPVGERFITVKSYRTTMLSPVGERFTVLKHHKKMLSPVGERFVTVKRYHKTILAPVGERVITTKIIRTRTILEPVGERTIITTRPMYSSSWWCD